MKKIIVSFFILISLTGCNSKVLDAVPFVNTTKEYVCEETEVDADNGDKTTNTITINHKDDLITKVKLVSVTNSDPSYYQMSIDMMNTVMEEYKKINGITFSIKSDEKALTMLIEYDFTKINIDEINALAAKYEKDGGTFTTNMDYLTDNKPSFKLFKEQELEGYTCK